MEYMTGGVAVILGATGRNVGAGMSGGYGYVLDLDRSLVNPERSEDVAGLSAEQAEQLREIIERHAQFTDSPTARQLLADWPTAIGRFSVIVPRDFRRVLEATSRAQANGEDVDAAVMAAALG